MAFEIPPNADGDVTETVERTHETLVNELGYDTENMLVTYNLGEDEMCVTFGENIAPLE